MTHNNAPQNDYRQHRYPQNEHQPPGPQDQPQWHRDSQNTEIDSDAEFDDGNVYDSTFLNDLDRIEAQQLKGSNAAPAEASLSPSKRRLRVTDNAPSYLRQEASRRANMAEPLPLPTATGPSPSSSTATPAVLPQGAAEALAAVGNLSPGSLAHVAEFLLARQQPASFSDPDAPQNPPQQSAAKVLESLFAAFQPNLGALEATDPPQQSAAQRSTSLPCATPQLTAPPQSHSTRSASVAPVVRDQPDAAPLSSFNKPTHTPPPASSDRRLAPSILQKKSGPPLTVPPSSPLNGPVDGGKNDKKPRGGSTKPTPSPRKSGGRPTKEQAQLIANSFRDIDETLFSAASGLNSNPRSVLTRYLRRFNLGYKSNPWNHYESWAKSPENVLMEMEHLRGTEHDAVYQEFMENPNRKPTVEEMRLTWPLFQAEHGEEKAKDLLAAWNSICEMDAGFVVQTKGERKRVWEGHIRRLYNFLDMLRNVFQMHVFAIGVGGQVNTDAGLHFVYQNYESKGFAESGFLKSIDQLIAFFKTHIYQEIKDQYTDQEIIAMAQERGYSVTRNPNTPPTTHTAGAAPKASTSRKQAISPVSPAPEAALPPIGAQGGASVQATPLPAPSPTGGADVVMQALSDGDSSDSEDEDEILGDPGIDVQKALVALLVQSNLTLGKPRSFPWLNLPKECFRRGVQVHNFPPRVALPWEKTANKNKARGAQKKGVKGLTPKHQRRLTGAINHPQYPLTFATVEVIDIQTDVLPFMTFAPSSKGIRRDPVFAKEIPKLLSLRTALSTKKKPAKRPKVETPEPETGSEVPPVNTVPAATSKSRARSNAVKSKPFVESDESDELDTDDYDSDIYGLQNMGPDDEEYQLESEKSPKRKRGGSKGNGKGKERADVDVTPRPKKPALSKAAKPVGFTSFERIAETRNASATLGRSIALSELDFQYANIPGGTSYNTKAKSTSRPQSQLTYAPGPSSSRQPTATPVQVVQPIQTPTVQGGISQGVPKPISFPPAVNPQVLRGIPGAAGRSRNQASTSNPTPSQAPNPPTFNTAPVLQGTVAAMTPVPQAPPSTASTSNPTPTQTTTSLPINAAPVSQGAVAATVPTPQAPLNVALEMLQKCGLTPQQIVALAQLGGAALGNGSVGGGAV